MSERISFYDQIRNNKIKSFVLVVAIFIFFLVLGSVISLVLDPSMFFFIMVLSIIISVIYVLVSYYNSDKIALASVKAHPASRIEHRALFNAAENMSLASGLPVPKLYVINSPQINAFATGRNPKNSVICCTTGALEKLEKKELEGVIAHEMSHIANYDIRFMTLVAVMIGMISIASEFFLRSLWIRKSDGDENRGSAILLVLGILFAILAPILANLVSLAISRKREFTADATGVKFTRSPTGLRNALIKIKKENTPEEEKRKIPKAVAPLFISDPHKKKLQNLFSTHPDIDERIKILEKM